MSMSILICGVFVVTGVNGCEWLAGTGENRFAFLNALPDRMVNPNPASLADVRHVLKTKCHCLQYCWENNEAPWLQRVEFVGDVMRKAIDA